MDIQLTAEQQTILGMLTTDALKQAFLSTVAKANAPKGGGQSIRVGTKGGVSLYGFGRRPVTLYQSQWEYLFGRIDDVKAFIKANESALAKKPVVEIPTQVKAA